MRLTIISPHLVCAPKEELFEKGIAFFQFAERKNLSVSGTDFRRIRKISQANLLQRFEDLPFASGRKIASADRIGKDKIADEKEILFFEEIAKRATRMSGYGDRFESDSRYHLPPFVENFDRTTRCEKAIEKHLRAIGVRPFDQMDFLFFRVNGAVELADVVVDAENVVEMPVRQEDKVDTADLPDKGKNFSGSIARIDEKISFAFDDVDVAGKRFL